MAIYSAVPPPPEDPPSNQASPLGNQTTATSANHSAIDIEAWTISALQSLSVSPIARGTGTPLSIPIDEHVTPSKRTASRQQVKIITPNDADAAVDSPPRRPPSARDSQKRREALLKGKEGSRQRRRWENDRLMHVPNVQPPEPMDWEVHPTHPIHRVPYQLAQFWDHGVRQRIEDKTSRLQAERKKQQLKTGSATGLGVGEVPRDLRETTKRSPVIRSWVKVLEEPVRQFLVSEQRRLSDEDVDSAAEEMDSEDEEIVFVGRNGAMRELREKRARYKMARREVSQQTVDSGVVFDSFGNDESAAFKRWLTHTISDYYGLASRSVTLANTSQRVVYVGLKQMPKKRTAPPLAALPRPLWELC